MRITEKELEKITDFQKHNNLENKTTEEILSDYFIRCDNCDELIPEIYSKDILDDNKEMKVCPLCYDEIYPPELTKEELEDIGEMQRGEAYYEAKRIEELEKCGK